ncbi:hypothetical protein D3C81_2087270 [compost metagenome]
MILGVCSIVKIRLLISERILPSVFNMVSEASIKETIYASVISGKPDNDAFKPVFREFARTAAEVTLLTR